MDGGWLCGSYGLEKAKSMIENGITTSAIVGVTNLVLIPEMQLQYQGINRLNKSVHTKPFSFDGKYVFYELNHKNKYTHISC